MPNEPPDRKEMHALRMLVEGFITERLKPKLEELDKIIAKETDPEKKEGFEEKRQKLVADYKREAWLESAAKRVSQIRLVTHAIKYAHPDARGNSVYLDELPSSDTLDSLVGTHGLSENRMDDVVGNAAALDVYKFLKLEYQGRSLLTRMLDRDQALGEALCHDLAQAKNWMERFAAITGSTRPLSSHTLAKQMYFPLPDGNYHLLAPLFPTSLAHTVHSHLRKARFSDEVKQARQARFESRAFAHGYSEYPSLAVQVFGGAKPQNISQLNSERYGENWLLPSLPPSWFREAVRPPLRVNTVFRRWFGGRPRVRELIKVLAEFLATTQYTNVHIRRTRADLVNRLADELVQFAAELSELPPGWSTDQECRLDKAEQLWLDPDRAVEDETFALQRRQGEWREEVASRFGSWLNHQLMYHSKKHRRLPMGEDEHAEWMRVVEPVLDNVREELAHD